MGYVKGMRSELLAQKEDDGHVASGKGHRKTSASSKHLQPTKDKHPSDKHASSAANKSTAGAGATPSAPAKPANNAERHETKVAHVCYQGVCALSHLIKSILRVAARAFRQCLGGLLSLDRGSTRTRVPCL
jgi:hypothetical protein